MNGAALYSVAQVRAIEQAAQTSLPAGTLMQRAGQATAETAQRLLPPDDPQQKILVASGPGNNGGDALEAAALLAQRGLRPFVVLLAETSALPADAHAAWIRANNAGVQFIDLHTALAETGWHLVLDGLFGIGLTRPLQGDFKQLAEAINQWECPVLAIDVPSGLNADTGCMTGPDGVAVMATHTLTFIADKPGLHTAYGRDYAGIVTISDLAIAPALFGPPHARLNGPSLFSHAAKKRKHASHKGSYGDLTVIGGAAGMTGAVILAARMAAMAGAGRVFAGFAGPAPAYDSVHPELMCRAADELNLSGGAIVAGPGLGTTRHAHDLLSRALGSDQPLVLDADALNLIALESSMQTKLATRRAPALLTPHPLEAARLAGMDSVTVQADRLHAAGILAKRFHAVVILKGSGSVIAHPDGRLVINTTGNPALATAGSGDVLAGLCGALLAQQWPLWETALAATWLHGKAADQLVAAGVGPTGLTAGELMPAIRSALNQLVRAD
jgi:hydroxyethylthiazole kinase-like uncharacterized protein yjeF